MTTWKAAPPPFAVRARLALAIEVVPLALAVAGVWVVGVSPLGLALFGVMYLLTMVGIEVGLHRLVAHRQFHAAPWLRFTLAALGAMAGEGTPLLWSAIHRLHHRDPDGADDVHSPVHGRSTFAERVHGFLWAQSLWYLHMPGILRFRRVVAGVPGADEGPAGAQATELARVVDDLRADPVLLLVERLYPALIVLGLAAPAFVGWAIAGMDGALTGLVWGGVVRLVVVQKVSFAVNSAGHTMGTRFIDTPDGSRNNVVMAALTLGSGWHNNHHAFPGSASVWLAPWHVDPSYALIRAFAAVGAARDVRTAEPAQIAARRAR